MPIFFTPLLYSLSSTCNLLKKSPNNYFFDKVYYGAFFFFHTCIFILDFVGLKATFAFLTFLLFFYSSGFGERLKDHAGRVYEGSVLSFLTSDKEFGAWFMIKWFFPPSRVMWHPTADPIGGFLWVSLLAYGTYGSGWVNFLSAQAILNFDL